MAIGGMLKRLGFPIALLAASACTVINAGDADALLVFEFIQQGSDVVLNVSGSLTGLPSGTPGSNSGTAIVGPGLAIISTGNITGTGYTISGPSNFGTGVTSMTYSGDSFNFSKSINKLTLDNAYVQGSAITGSGLFTTNTLAGLGLSATSGLLGTWTIGTDSIQVWAGPVPQPSSVPGPLPLLGAAAAFSHSRRLRARVRAGSASQA